MAEMLAHWQERIRAAAADRLTLRPRGGGSKDFYGDALEGEVFDTREFSGIVAYEPTELVIVVRAGTPLSEIEAALAEKGQMLAFEPPRFCGGEPTAGGLVAAGLAGPRRQQAGSVRDYVLGLRLVDGRGDLLHFGGEVMKNVAGYDVSRLIAGSLGTLGLIAEVSLKVLPRPPASATLRFAMAQEAAIAQLNRWGGQPLPLSASCWHDGMLTIRLEGARAAVDSAVGKLGGARLGDDEADAFWAALRDQTNAFFAASGDPLWRLAVASTAPPLALPGATLIEWGGGQRWLRGELPVAELRAVAAAAGGHATRFRSDDAAARTAGVFTPPAPALLAIHRRLKDAFDPQRVFSPGRLYPEL